MSLTAKDLELIRGVMREEIQNQVPPIVCEQVLPAVREEIRKGIMPLRQDIVGLKKDMAELKLDMDWVKGKITDLNKRDLEPA